MKTRQIIAILLFLLLLTGCDRTEVMEISCPAGYVEQEPISQAVSDLPEKVTPAEASPAVSLMPGAEEAVIMRYEEGVPANNSQTLTGKDAEKLTQILFNLPYESDICLCANYDFLLYPDYYVSFSEGYARHKKADGQYGQTQLTETQLESLRQIIETLPTEEAAVQDTDPAVYTPPLTFTAAHKTGIEPQQLCRNRRPDL
ncbi:MAG: hypothetical protein IJ043_08465 [Clostridia bacterium]|nr:hypothetical protein [Clostridia bacterium]